MIIARLWISILVVGPLFLSSCTVYRVKPWNSDGQPDGIPFYTTKPVCEQKTTYIEPIYTIVVTKPSEGQDSAKPATALTRNLNLHVRISTQCAAQISSLLLGNVPVDKDTPATAVLSSCPEVEPRPAKSFPPEEDLLLAGNTASFANVIDADHRYFVQC